MEKKTLSGRAQRRANIAKTTKDRMVALKTSVATEIMGMMVSANVGAVRFPKGYDKVTMNVDDDEAVRMDALFLHNDNLYAFSNEKGEDEGESLSSLFGETDCLTEDHREEIDLFIEDTDNPLYNVLDDTYSPFETMDEILDVLPVLLTDNDL